MGASSSGTCSCKGLCLCEGLCLQGDLFGAVFSCCAEQCFPIPLCCAQATLLVSTESSSPAEHGTFGPREEMLWICKEAKYELNR